MCFMEVIFMNEELKGLTKDEWLKEVNNLLLKLDINLCDAQGYYRSTFDIMNELSEKWHYLKEKEIKNESCYCN